MSPAACEEPAMHQKSLQESEFPNSLALVGQYQMQEVQTGVENRRSRSNDIGGGACVSCSVSKIRMMHPGNKV